MNKEKISSQEIIDLVASKASVSKRASEEFLKVMISTIEEALLAGESVKIKHFGTFKLHWNEPRKSVNVQTGEDIIIAGYYKVNFVPDSVLKDQVNEPFAHLEPVRLDGEDENAIESVEIDTNDSQNTEVPEPLRIFTEQASEIKNLISEIQALSANNNSMEIEDDFEEEIDEDEVIEDEKITEEVEEVVLADNLDQVVEKEVETTDNSEFNDVVDTKYPEQVEVTATLISENTNEESVEELNTYEETTEISPEQIEKDEEFKEFLETVDQAGTKKRTFWWSVVVLVVLILGGTAVYKLYPPVTNYIDNKIDIMQLPERYAATRYAISQLLTSEKKSDVVTDPISERETKVFSKDTTEISEDIIEEPVDSLQILFDTPRVYPEFIATVKLNYGSRLTLISQKYYGNPDFWVYIYEANSDRFNNPDQIKTGSLIHVPKIDPRLIDASNPRCIEKARELHDLYVKK